MISQVLLSLLSPLQPVEPLPKIPVGELVEARIDPTDPVIETTSLKRWGSERFPARGKSYRFEVDAEGDYVISLRTRWFEPILVLRDGSGKKIREDIMRTVFPRIVAEDLEVGESYWVDVGSWYGEPGPFELRIQCESSMERESHEDPIAFLESGLRVLRREVGRKSAAYGSALHRLGKLRLVGIDALRC